MLKIGKLNIKYKAMLSPLASLTDISFRKLLDEIGYCGLMVTEMISAEGIRRGNEKTLKMMRFFDCNTPQFVQLFGSHSEQFVDAVKYIENETSFSGVDINMGCPKNKVVKKGSGASLLRDPLYLAKMIREVKKNTSIPLTVKVRLGYSEVNIFEVMDLLEKEGVDAVTVHFRLQSDSYSQRARWEYAPEIKKSTKYLL